MKKIFKNYSKLPMLQRLTIGQHRGGHTRKINILSDFILNINYYLIGCEFV